MTRKFVRHRPDAVFVLEANGVALVAFAALNSLEARAIRYQEWFQQDLYKLKSNGVPIWDGVTKLVARRAAGEELARYEQAARDVGPSDDLVMAFLIELDDAPNKKAPPADR